MSKAVAQEITTPKEREDGFRRWRWEDYTFTEWSSGLTWTYDESGHSMFFVEGSILGKEEMIFSAYTQGVTRGEIYGQNMAKATMRDALGL